jgi:hypothetical protein
MATLLDALAALLSNGQPEGISSASVTREPEGMVLSVIADDVQALRVWAVDMFNLPEPTSMDVPKFCPDTRAWQTSGLLDDGTRIQVTTTEPLPDDERRFNLTRWRDQLA